MTNNLLPEPIEADRIMQYLPHRYPFLLVDRVISLQMEPTKTIIATKNVTINEPFFTGHFPGNPVMPGVLIIEAMAQAAGILASLDAELDGRRGALNYLVKVDNARFTRIVRPGDQLELEVTQTRIVRSMGMYSCEARVAGRTVASCDIMSAAGSEK